MKDLEEVLDLETEIIFQTDQKGLFKDSLKVVKGNKKYKFEKFYAPLFGIQSYWELMKIKEGDKIYRMKISLRDKTKK